MTPTLIYCAARSRLFADIALRYGYAYGAQLPSTIYHAPYFVDQNWRKPVRDVYMAALKEHRPALASVLDWEREEQLSEVLEWAEAAAQWVTESVIIIPKVVGGVHRIPRSVGGKPVRLGYSVPTTFAGSSVSSWEMAGWPVHLLGGSPQAQMETARYLDVKSVDGNAIQEAAVKRSQCWFPGNARHTRNRWFPQLQELGDYTAQDVPYRAFTLSCINVRNAWRGVSVPVRYANMSDLPAVKQIANHYSGELGYVMWPKLREAVAKSELFVAEQNGAVVGFVNWHLRRDGWSTIYELAVAPEWRGQRVGEALLNAVPAPRRLKCTLDNTRANAFYGKVNGALVREEQGRKRALNVYEWGG